ncbi:tyrosine-type recombinase/integrase [Streptomyces sp. NPDC000658]|uniref:tyrosine-type recombinase/integrase n=1 Tax=Streptomyces sp. NPDC000658 TaxID=3154266 RepID=UPI00331DBE07
MPAPTAHHSLDGALDQPEPHPRLQHLSRFRRGPSRPAPSRPEEARAALGTLSSAVRAGVRKVRFHDLRHTCASLLHEQGADARMIMEVLGHSSIRVTMDI